MPGRSHSGEMESPMARSSKAHETRHSSLVSRHSSLPRIPLRSTRLRLSAGSIVMATGSTCAAADTGTSFLSLKHSLQSKDSWRSLPDSSLSALATARDSSGRSLLFYVTTSSTADFLLTHGCDAELRDKYGQCALHTAVAAQQLEVVQVLLRHCPALLQQRDDAQRQPVHEVADREMLESAAHRQQRARARPSRSRCLPTALTVHMFAACRSCEVSACSRSRSGQCRWARRSSAAQGCSHRARRHRQVRPQPSRQRPALLPCCASAQARAVLCCPGCRYLLSQSVSVDARDSAGRTAVHRCSEYGHLSLLRPLLAASASPLTADNAGWTPLHCAALGAWPMHESHRELITALLQAGADVHATEAQGLTALHVCTDTPAARRLLNAGADITASDGSGRMPLHYASHENSMSDSRRAQAAPTVVRGSLSRLLPFCLAACWWKLAHRWILETSQSAAGRLRLSTHCSWLMLCAAVCRPAHVTASSALLVISAPRATRSSQPNVLASRSLHPAAAAASVLMC